MKLIEKIRSLRENVVKKGSRVYIKNNKELKDGWYDVYEVKLNTKKLIIKHNGRMFFVPFNNMKINEYEAILPKGWIIRRIADEHKIYTNENGDVLTVKRNPILGKTTWLIHGYIGNKKYNFELKNEKDADNKVNQLIN